MSHECEQFEARLDRIVKGQEPIPNAKEVPLDPGVANIASLGYAEMRHGSYRTADQPWAGWAAYWLYKTQGGQYDGTGLAALYDKGHGRIVTFSICEHEKVAGLGAIPSRGWHPGRCSKCGLDMTVDSGD